MRRHLATHLLVPFREEARTKREAPANKGRTWNTGVVMKPRLYTVTALISLAIAGLVPAAAVEAQQVAPAPASSFEAEVAAARTAMMADPQAALAHARTAVVLASHNSDEDARRIGEATGSWLEAEALMRVNRP